MTRSIRFVLVKIVVALALPPLTVMADQAVDARGHYYSSFEYSELIPCGDTVGWWLTPNDTFSKRYLALGNSYKDYEGSNRPVFVHLKGELAGPGQYGHLGNWNYEFTVRKVLAMRLATEQDCNDEDAHTEVFRLPEP
jgi:hypothetical protein